MYIILDKAKIIFSFIQIYAYKCMKFRHKNRFKIQTLLIDKPAKFMGNQFTNCLRTFRYKTQGTWGTQNIPILHEFGRALRQFFYILSCSFFVKNIPVTFKNILNLEPNHWIMTRVLTMWKSSDNHDFFPLFSSESSRI